MGVKSIVAHLNASGIRTRDGGRWGVDAVHKVLTRTTYIGRHRFNTKFWKTRERKAETEIVEMAVPAIVDKDEFEVVQMLLKSRSPAMVAPRIVSGPTLLTGICFCAACGGAMTLRTGKSGRYRYYTCCTKARQGETGCPGRTVPMEKLDNLRSTSSSVCWSPSVLSRFCRTYSIAAPSAPSDESCTSPNCTSGQTPNSGGSTMPSRTVSPISPTPC